MIALLVHTNLVHQASNLNIVDNSFLQDRLAKCFRVELMIDDVLGSPLNIKYHPVPFFSPFIKTYFLAGFFHQNFDHGPFQKVL